VPAVSHDAIGPVRVGWQQQVAVTELVGTLAIPAESVRRDYVDTVTTESADSEEIQRAKATV
jgi:hypothetical protein